MRNFSKIEIFHKKKTKAGAFEVYVSLNSVMLQTALIWFFCYHSALVTQRLDEIGDYAYSLKWYRYSEVSQKPTLMLIRQSNKRLTYSGLGIFRCDMQTFSMVCFTFNFNLSVDFFLNFFFRNVSCLFLDGQLGCVLLFAVEENLNAYWEISKFYLRKEVKHWNHF